MSGRSFFKYVFLTLTSSDLYMFDLGTFHMKTILCRYHNDIQPSILHSTHISAEIREVITHPWRMFPCNFYSYGFRLRQKNFV